MMNECQSRLIARYIARVSLVCWKRKCVSKRRSQAGHKKIFVVDCALAKCSHVDCVCLQFEFSSFSCREGDTSFVSLATILVCKCRCIASKL